MHQAAREFIFQGQSSEALERKAKRRRTGFWHEDEGFEETTNQWILRPSRTLDGPESRPNMLFDYENEHEIDLRLISLLYHTAIHNDHVRSGVEIIQNHVATGDLQVYIKGKLIKNFLSSYTQYFQDLYLQVLQDAMLMQLVWGLVAIGVRVDYTTGIVVPYVPDYGTFKIAIIRQHGVQKYTYYELDAAKSTGGKDVWRRNNMVSIYDTLNRTARPYMDGSLNSRLVGLLRAINDLDHMLESVAVADELASRPATTVGVEAMPPRPIDAASSQIGVHFGDAPLRSMRNISMNVPLATYPQSDHMERELHRTVTDANALRAALQESDSIILENTAQRRARETMGSEPQTVYTVAPHLKVERLALPPHPGSHFTRSDFYIGEIANALSIPQQMLMASSSTGGLGNSASGAAAYALQIQRFNSMIRKWNIFFMRIMNTTNRLVLFINGHISSVAQLKNLKLNKSQQIYADMRASWITNIMKQGSMNMQKVLSNPDKVSDTDLLAYIYAADDEGVLRLNFSAAPSAVGVDTLMQLKQEKTLKRAGYISLLSEKLAIDLDKFEEKEPAEEGTGPAPARKPAAQRKMAQKPDAPAKKVLPGETTAIDSSTEAQQGSETDTPRRSARLQQQQKKA